MITVAHGRRLSLFIGLDNLVSWGRVGLYECGPREGVCISSIYLIELLRGRWEIQNGK